MTRTTGVTVCIVAGDDRRATRKFLDRLAPALDDHDSVVVVGPGRPPASDASAWRALAGKAGLRPTGRDHAPRPRPIVVLVDDRVDPPEDWLTLLVDALAEPGVGAAAPRSNVADGDELFVGIPYRPDEHGLRRRFARDLTISARGQLSEATILDGPCVAVRREVLEGIGGLAPILEQGYDPAGMSIRIREAGGRLVVAESCFVHHPGGPSRRPDPRRAGRPFVSACLIVRDEEKNLADCLTAIAGLADEMVVYDTGSLDRTAEIAEHAGATVVRGYWDDDFARARNDALEHCHGQWILWVDADERLVCDDPGAVRRELMALTTDVEAYVVLIDNLNGNQAALTFTHPACRLFRRAYGHWEGHLHELVVARAGTPELARPLFTAGRISHLGYLQTFVTERSKGERNLRTAFGDLAGGSNLDWEFRLSSLGRSYAGAGRFEEAVEHCRNAATLAEAAGRASTARLARRTAIDCLLALGRNEEALEELAPLQQAPGSPLLGALLEGRVRQALGEDEAALECFSRVRTTIDDDGFEYSRAMVAAPRAEILRSMGRHDEASSTLIEALRDGDGIDAHLGLLIESMEIAGRDLGEIYDALGDARVEHFVPQLLQLQPPAADRALESWRARAPGSQPILAAGASIARRLEVPRQLVWSARLREAGYPDSCPLVAASIEPAGDARDRVLAAAVAFAMFGDARARHAFGPALLCVPSGQRAQLDAEVAAIAPALLGALRSLEATPEPERPVAEPTGKRVLIVECRPTDLRSTGIANHLVAAGHEVTFVGPQIADGDGGRLLAGSVHRRGFQSSSATREHRIDACRAALTLCSAGQAFDAVIVSRSATELLPIARSLFPEVTIVVDHHGANDAERLPSGADAVWTTRPGTAPTADHPVELAPGILHTPPPAGHTARGPLRRVHRGRRGRRGRRPARGAGGRALGACAGGDPGEVPGSDRSRLSRYATASATTRPRRRPGRRSTARPGVMASSRGSPSSRRAEAPTGGWKPLEPAERPQSRSAAAASHSNAPSATSPCCSRTTSPGSRPTRRSARRPRPRLRTSSFPRSGALRRAEADGQTSAGASGFRFVGDDGPLAVWRRAAPGLLGHLEKLAAATPLLNAGPNLLELRDAPTPDFRRTPGTRIVPLVAWDYGGLPAEWIAPIRDVTSEIWVPSAWARDHATASGVAADKVFVIGPGIDASVFRPSGPPRRLATARPKRLLFVGTATEQDGVDALLEAYLTAFEGHGDVCLVLNLQPPDPTSRSASFDVEIRRAAAAKPGAIEIIDDSLDPAQRAELYRACDALVAPHRARAFATTIAEAMACELPVVALDRGPQAELCSEDTAWLVASREVSFSLSGWTPTAAGFSWNEPSRGSLLRAMRDVLRDRDAAKLKVSHARECVLGRFTLETAVAAAERRVSALLSLPGS